MNNLSALQVGIWLVMEDTTHLQRGMEDLLLMGGEVVDALGYIVAEVEKKR